jgi:hypothetical protein
VTVIQAFITAHEAELFEADYRAMLEAELAGVCVVIETSPYLDKRTPHLRGVFTFPRSKHTRH